MSSFIRSSLHLGIVAGSAFLAACGGASSPESTTPATTNEGEVITTNSGQTVSENAHNYWQEGITAFQQHEQSGWNSSACSDVERSFMRAAEAQGNRFAEAFYMAGLVHTRCNERNEAHALYERALSANANLCKARVAIGVEQLGAGETQPALATFRLAIQNDRMCTEAYVNLASILRTSGDATQADEAISNLRKALTLDATYMPAFNELALLYYGQAETNAEKIDLATIICVQAIRINANYAPIYNTMGLIQLRRGDLIEAVRAFDKAIQLDNSLVESLMNFGQITLGFRGYEDAHRAFSRVVELQANNYDARIGLGAALRGLTRFDEAQAAYEAAQQLDANRPESYFNLALLYQDYKGGSIEMLERAKTYYEQFLAKASTNARYSSTVESVRRRCEQRSSGRRRRLASASCRPGQLQNIETAIQAQNTMQQMQRLQEQQQQQMQQLEQQQQQQQQQPAPAAEPAPAAPAAEAVPAAAPAPAAAEAAPAAPAAAPANPG